MQFVAASSPCFRQIDVQKGLAGSQICVSAEYAGRMTNANIIFATILFLNCLRVLELWGTRVARGYEDRELFICDSFEPVS